MNNAVFIDMVEQQWVVHWLGVPYLVESSYRGRFFNVLDINEQPIEYMLESTILYKFFKMKLNVRTLVKENCNSLHSKEYIKGYTDAQYDTYSGA